MTISRLLLGAIFFGASCSAAFAAPIDHFACKRLSGGPASPFTLTIDYGAKTVDVPPSTGLETDPDTVVITSTSVAWSVARGGIVFNRSTQELDWDMTDDYDYLDSTGQFTSPVEDYRGKMHCKIVK
jgi:hypothetical protein